MRTGARAVGVAVVIVAVVMPAGVSQAAPSWLGPERISPAGEGAGSARVVVEAGGGVIASWSRGLRAEYSYRPPGGTFGPPAFVTPMGQDWEVRDLAANSQGAALMVLEEQDMTRGLGVSFRAPGGAFTQLDPLSTTGGGQESEGSVGEDGTMAAIWQRTDTGGDSRAEVAIRPAGQALFGLPAFVSPDGVETTDHAIAVGPDGTVIAMWREQHSGSVFEYWAAARAPGQSSFGSPERVSLDDKLAFGLPDLEVAADGTAIAVWPQGTGSSTPMYHAMRPPGGPFGAAQPLSPDGLTGDAQVAVDGAGNALAVWQRAAPMGQPRVEASFRPAGGSFGQEQTVGGQSTVDPGAALGGDGSALVVFRNLGNSGVEAVRRLPGAKFFGAPFGAVASNGEASSFGFPQASQLGMDAQGNGAVALVRSDGSDARVEVAGFDAAGPILDGLAIPAAGERAVPLPFAVAPRDVWSPIAGTTWAFGDGTSGDGAATSHAYATTGAFPVSVTSTDAVGNATTATGQVNVTDSRSPGITTRIPRQRLRRVLRRGLRVQVASDEAGQAVVEALVNRRLLRRPSGSALARVGRRARAVQAGGRMTVTVRLSRKARRRLAQARRVRFTLRFRVTDASGNRAAATRRATVRR